LDETSAGLDSVLDDFFSEEVPAEEQASPEADTESADDVDVQPEVAVADALPPTEAVAPSPDYAAQLDAMQAQLAQVSEKAQFFDQLQELAAQRQAEEAERLQFDDWQARYEAAADLPDAQRQAEVQRIAREIKQSSVQPVQAQLAQADSTVEEVARAASAIYTLLPNYLTPEQLAQLQEDAAHARQFSSPDAMLASNARDKAIADRAIARYQAELAKGQDAGLVAAAQERIASDADLVGAGAGAPAVGGGGIDNVLDSLFGK
jgi:hypothetical protein